MDPDEENNDMLDMLAYNCSALVEKFNSEKSSPEEQNTLLMNYIKKTDAEQKSINDFKEDLDWFNVTEPLSTKDSLQGKIVVLDFFTYCCINCMHVLPDLKKIEQLYTVEDGLVVIGVHSAKFDNEKDSSNILSAIQRYDITHPVVNDSTSSMWIDLKIVCWPTLLVLGPRANPLFVLMGEGHYDLLEKYIGAAIKFYKTNDSLKSHSLPLNPSTELLMSSQLKFPGKIVCSEYDITSENTELYAISDSGNHRILIITFNGQILYKIGGKSCGFADGDFQTARFNAPQGLAFQNANTIFVADSENHAIRKIDLTAKSVSTVAGTGVQGTDRIGGKIGIEQEISSPWDVIVYRTRDMDMSFHLDEQTIPEKEIVFIAAAGTHQIWAIFLNDVIWWKFKKIAIGTVVSIAGNGQEENRNNSYPYNAGFAQPSGLAIDRENKDIYIADSESSCIRKLSLVDGKVLPVAGGDRNPFNLFAFGDVDGKQYVAKLQHPLAVAYNPKDNCVYVADTYNHKIKRIDTTTSFCTSLHIVDKSGNTIQFNEPGGLCVSPSGKHLYVADTNNHAIEIVDLETLTAQPLRLIESIERKTYEPIDLGQTLKCDPFVLPIDGGKISLKISLNTFENVKLAKDAPQKWSVNLPNETWTISRGRGSVLTNQTIDLDINVPSAMDQPKKQQTQHQVIYITFKLILCAADICFPKSFSIALNVSYADHGTNVIIYELKPMVSKDEVTL